MKKNCLRGIGIILSALLLLQTVCVPVNAENTDTGVTVTTSEEFMAALTQKQSPITVEGSITIGDEADSTGKMYPVEIPEDTVIQGNSDASLNCRCPIQLSGDNVMLKNIELTFDSSDALGSVPHREIFLAGYSLTMDNVKTYLAGSGGSLGGLGGTEEELLPTVYAGGFENTSVGTNASLTVQNANSETMFKGIYMSHEEGDDSKVPYTGAATVNMCPKMIVREGIFTDANSSAEITISGTGNVTDVIFYGNDNTNLSISQASLYRTLFDGVGELVLDDNAYLELQQDSLNNITLKNGACLDWNNRTDVTVLGNFTGGAYDEAIPVDERGVLVLNEEGSLTVQGAVSNTTIVQTENRNFPGEFTSEKQYIIADAANQGMGFVLPEIKSESYELVYEENGWTIYELESGDLYPIVGSIDVLYAPTEVDVTKIVGSNNVPSSEEFYCDVIWKDEEGNAISTEMVEELWLYAYDTIIGIKTEYWQDENALEQEDWGNVIQFVSSPETVPNRYYLYVEQGDAVKTGDYTFLFCSEYYDPENEPITVADVKALKDKVKAEISVKLYDSTLEPPSTDIEAESIVVKAIEEQTYTGEEIKPSITVTDSGLELQEGIDYQVTYENNIEVGVNTAKIVLTGIGSYEGTREILFSIVKCDPVLMLTANGEQALEAEYGQEIGFSLRISPYECGEDGNSDSAELYMGDTLLGSASIDEKGQASLQYQTTDRTIPVGTSDIKAVFAGTVNVNAAVTEVSVTLNKKQILLDDIASVSLKDFTCDDVTKTTDILSITDKEGDVYPVTGVAELADTQAGSYNTAKVINWLLNEEYDVWYQLPMAPETVAVSPQVNILPKPEPEPDPDPEPEHTHNYIASVTKESTCTEPGIETYQCTGCEGSYTKELPLKEHSREKIVQKAGPGQNGYTAEKCVDCGSIFNRKTIVAPKAIKLSKNEYIYSGKARKPSVKVTDKNGNTIKSGNYTVTYRKNKNVGKATVTVRFKNDYSGALKATFTINPKATTIVKLKAESKGFTVKWKKQSTQISGYEIEYSTSNKFSKKLTKSITIKSNKSTSKTIKKLKANKKYFVRIRTYKTIKVNGKSGKLYSSWSKVKTVKTDKG